MEWARTRQQDVSQRNELISQASAYVATPSLDTEVMLPVSEDVRNRLSASPSERPTVSVAPGNRRFQFQFLAGMVGSAVASLPLALRVREEFSMTDARDSSGNHKQLSLIGMLGKAELGRIYSDLAGIPHERKTMQELSARAYSIVSVTDFFIDETDMPELERVVVLRSMEAALTSGTDSRFRQPQLNKVVEACQLLHQKSVKMPNGDTFLAAFSRLANAAIEQIKNPGSIHSAVVLGSETGGLVGALSQALCSTVDTRLILISQLFGAHVQLLDDIQDYRHDREHGLHTPITGAADPERAAFDALQLSEDLYSHCMELLTSSEKPVFAALRRIGALKWAGLSTDSVQTEQEFIQRFFGQK